MGSGVLLDPVHGVLEVHNESDVPTSEIELAMRRDPQGAQVLAALSTWVTAAAGGGSAAGGYGEGDAAGGTGRPSRQGNLFDRDRYVTPTNVYDQMRLAYQAVEDDDVVAGVLESTEALAFSKISFFAEDEDEEDVYNQIGADLQLDARLREMWREMFTVSQVYGGVYWGSKTYKVRGKTKDGNARRRSMTLRVPLGITMLDPLKIVPVGNTMFNREQLAYVADRNEDELFQKNLGSGIDPIIERLLMGRYTPATLDERKTIADLGLVPDRMWLLNPVNVFRHTATRPQFERFARVRLKSIFELLDMKHQLRSMDRAHLIGGTNFIVLITKGSDDHPAKPAEIANLQAQVRVVARTPVLVGDHRLNVQIITPTLDNTLKPERYDTLDARITARLFQMFMLGSGSAGSRSDDSAKLVKVIARGLESRRHMMRRTLEAAIFEPIFTLNDALMTPCKLKFHPHQIALDFDDAFASFLIELRQNREISRDTLLSTFDMDQDAEARALEREKDKYDDIFETAIPFNSPANQPGRTQEGEPAPEPTPAEKRQAGRQGGGNRNGGGSAPGTGQGKPARRVRKKAD